MVTVLDKTNSVLSQYMAELREKQVQKYPMRFRKNIERIGEIMAYEVSKMMTYVKADIHTPLGIAEGQLLESPPVIATILRAGLPFHAGFLNFFDHAGSLFAAAYRRHTTETEFEIQLDYLSGPSLEGKILILADTMLATGRSAAKVYDMISTTGKPAFTHICAVISAQPGIDYLTHHLKGQNYHIWTAALDKELDARSYIVPGLGDAGDLAFGEKS